MYNHALVAMKAMPFHRGHEYLIDTAIKQSLRVTVFVVWAADQWPDGETRADWVQKSYPNADVRLITDICTDDNDPKSSVLWGIYTRDMLGQDMPDVVFSSEDYGARWAKEIGAAHVAVDPHRTRIPVSGTKIRNDPYLHWQYLNRYARLSYLKRVLIVGAESTGKSTLCANLANKYGTLYVPEYGRIYSEMAGPDRESMTKEQERIIFSNIVNEQPRLAREIEADARLVCFHDTDLYLTSLWYERWQPESPHDGLYSTIWEAAAYADNFDLVLISDPFTDFHDDGYREFSQEDREEFTARLKGIFSARYKLLSGTWDEREKAAIRYTNHLFEGSAVTLPTTY